MKRIVHLMTAAALSAAGSARAEPESVESLAKRLDAAVEKAPALSYTQEFKSEVDSGGVLFKSLSKARIDTLRKGKKDLFNLKVEAESSAGDKKNKSSGQSSFDGEVIASLTEDGEGEKVAIKQKVTEDVQMVRRGAALLDDFKGNYELKFLPNEKVDGVETAVVEAVAKEASLSSGLPPKKRVWIDLQHGLVTHVIDYNPSGKVVMEMTVKDLKADVKFAPDHFAMKFPEGVDVIDLTTLGGDDAMKPERPADGGKDKK